MQISSIVDVQLSSKYTSEVRLKREVALHRFSTENILWNFQRILTKTIMADFAFTKFKAWKFEAVFIVDFSTNVFDEFL